MKYILILLFVTKLSIEQIAINMEKQTPNVAF